MDDNYDILIKAINERRLVSVTFNSKEKGIITRTCVPFDFGPGKREKSGKEKYHFWNLDSNHNMPVLPEQIISIKILDATFSPSEYIKWTPDWNIKRDWGVYS